MRKNRDTSLGTYPYEKTRLTRLTKVAVLGYDSLTASRLLLEWGKIAATPMRDWSEVNSDQFVRLVAVMNL